MKRVAPIAGFSGREYSGSALIATRAIESRKRRIPVPRTIWVFLIGPP
jgi:hypothetical protein